uniref:Uncharacterized protein n=1 Tax=Treubia lacunosa TaxID=93845 RepID=G4Y9W2_9MARC|nr:hypothetical protein TrlaMp63 [Treubia lacunosa]AEH99758.1 hypothetical protein TrlaMp63 [Treubia lacunosa]
MASIDPVVTSAPAEQAAPGTNYLWVSFVVCAAVASIVLLYYITRDPITDIPIMRERDESVLSTIPENLRDQFSKDLALFNKRNDSFIMKNPEAALPSVPKGIIRPGNASINDIGPSMKAVQLDPRASSDAHLSNLLGFSKAKRQT